MKIKEALLLDIKKLKAPGGYLYAGLPRFKALFGRDSCISAWQLLGIYPKIALFTLKILAKYQGQRINYKREEEPGKIIHEHYEFFFSRFIHQVQRRFTWGYPYYGSIDSTAWWLILLGKYYRKTGDGNLVKELWPNILKALRWIKNYGDLDRDGLVEYENKNPFACIDQGWKDGLELYIPSPVAIVEVQGYYYLAYQEIAYLAERVLGEKDLSQRLRNRAEILRAKFNREFWADDQKYFVLALNGKKEKVKIATSNPGHCLFAGIIEDDKVEKVVKRLFEKDLWTPYGIRTHSSEDVHFNPQSYHQGSIWPHDNWIIYKGLQKYGYQKEADMIKQSQIKVFEAFGHIPECFAVKDNKIMPFRDYKGRAGACLIQAWASAGLLEMIWED